MAAKSKIAKAACVIGWPVEHSRSPLIHGYWIKKYRLNAEYRREAVPPEKFVDFVDHLAERGYVGANVTIPNKEAALRAVEGRRPRRQSRRRQYALARRYDAALDQHRRRRLHQQSRCVRRRLEPRTGDRRGAGRRWNRARRRLWTERARREAHPRGQPHARSGDGAARGIRHARQSGALGGTGRPCSPAPACW